MFSYLENLIIMDNMYLQILEKFLLGVGVDLYSSESFPRFSCRQFA